MNTVRITLSSAFWRNLNGSCPTYKTTVSNAIANAESAGLYVILTLQWDAPFSLADDAKKGGAQCPLPDATYDVAFWQDLAALYQDDPHAIFDLFSEPHDVNWSQWRNGGTITSACSRYAAPHTYQAIGMPALASKVREIAPSNLIILSGIGWGYDLSGVQAATDSLKNVVFGAHPFNHGGRLPAARRLVTRLRLGRDPTTRDRDRVWLVRLQDRLHRPGHRLFPAPAHLLRRLGLDARIVRDAKPARRLVRRALGPLRRLHQEPDARRIEGSIGLALRECEIKGYPRAIQGSPGRPSSTPSCSRSGDFPSRSSVEAGTRRGGRRALKN